MNKYKIIFNILLVAGFIIFGIWKYHDDDKKGNALINQWRKEYPNLKVSDSLDDTIKNIYKYEGNVAFSGMINNAKITMTNNKKISIWVDECINNPDIFLSYIIKNGDILHKNINSDTLVVISKNKKYIFLLD